MPRVESPDRAVALWGALVDGHWSLVDSTDHDGRRCLLARRNPPFVPEPTALAPEERVVLALFAHGHSGKVIAYDLGIAPSTVSSRLRRGLKKLGLRSLVELSAALSPAGREAEAQRVEAETA